MNAQDLKTSLAALASHAAAELRAKHRPGETISVEKAFFKGSELARTTPHWGDAIMCDGLVRASRVLHDEVPAQTAIAWFAPRLAGGARTGDWFWFWAAEGLAAIDLYQYCGEAPYLDFARGVVDALENRIAHTPDGAIMPHPPNLEVWVDVVYFSTPAMARLGRLTGDKAMVGRALRQLMLHAKHLRDDATGLFWHVAYVDKHSHSACLWARGNSWFSVAATEVLGEVRTAKLENELAAQVRDVSETVARQLASVIKLQDREGLWHTVIDRPDSYLEASATAGFALALGRALKLGLAGLDPEAVKQAHSRALAAVCAKINSEGDFTGVAEQTPPGDFAWYQSIPVGTAPFGTGICLMALAEGLSE
jgi:unsaturated rhamnogalacturonyl hydrolase